MKYSTFILIFPNFPVLDRFCLVRTRHKMKCSRGSTSSLHFCSISCRLLCNLYLHLHLHIWCPILNRPCVRYVIVGRWTTFFYSCTQFFYHVTFFSLYIFHTLIDQLLSTCQVLQSYLITIRSKLSSSNRNWQVI